MSERLRARFVEAREHLDACHRELTSAWEHEKPHVGARFRAAIAAIIDANYACTNASLRWQEALGIATPGRRAELDRQMRATEAGYRELLEAAEKEGDHAK